MEKKNRDGKHRTLSAAMVTPAAIDTRTCLSASTGLISARTVETYCGLTAMKTMSEDWTTCCDEVGGETQRERVEVEKGAGQHRRCDDGEKLNVFFLFPLSHSLSFTRLFSFFVSLAATSAILPPRSTRSRWPRTT